MPNILIVDDDSDILEILEYNLRKEGHKVESAQDGKEALEKLKDFKADLIVLDVMMPRMDGIETARQIRRAAGQNDTYIVFLTARTEEYSEVAGFEAGADDYISKPIKPRALLSRINAYFRRETSKDSEAELEVAGLRINKGNYSVLREGVSVVLPKKEFELLYFMAKNPDKVFSRDEFLKKIWGADIYVLERTVDVHIRKLREKLGEGYIRTLKGVGYMLNSERDLALSS